MTTSEPASNGGEQNPDQLSIWSVEGSPASRSHQLAYVEALLMNGGDGLGSQMWFAVLDLASSSWRTSQPSLAIPQLSDHYSPTWPTSGSMRNGRCYQRAPLVRHIHDSGCSYWPTPRALMARCKATARYRGNLEEAVALRGDSGGYLNHQWVAWLMGFPPDWCMTPFTPSATPSSPKSPNTSGG
jgi:hypothetical protein